MIKSSIRTSIKQSIRRSILGNTGDVNSAITRYFAQLDPVQQSYYSYANTLVFGAGDTFEFEFLAPTGVLSSTMYLIDGDGTVDRSFLLMQALGNFDINNSVVSSFELDGVSVALDGAYPVDGKLHTIKINYSNTARLRVMGSQHSGVQFYDGIIANPVATIGGVTTSNTLGLATGNVEASVTTGPANSITYVNIPDAQREKYTLIDGSWLSSVNNWDAGNAVFDGTESSFSIKVTDINALDIGVKYKVNAVNSITSGAAFFESFDGTNHNADNLPFISATVTISRCGINGRSNGIQCIGTGS